MKKVYICAAFGYAAERQLERYVRYALKSGVSPVVPETYAVCLHQLTPEEKALSKAAGRSYLWLCDELWVVGDVVTRRMREEIKFCKHLNIRIRRITELEVDNGIGDGRYEEKSN